MNDTAPPPPISPAHSRQQAVAGSAPSTPSAGGNAGAEGVLSPSQKRASFFGDLFANIAGSFRGLDGEEEGDGDAAGGRAAATLLPTAAVTTWRTPLTPTPGGAARCA